MRTSGLFSYCVLLLFVLPLTLSYVALAPTSIVLAQTPPPLNVTISSNSKYNSYTLGQSYELTVKVTCSVTNKDIPYARIEFWFKYPNGTRRVYPEEGKPKQYTDDKGNYKLTGTIKSEVQYIDVTVWAQSQDGRNGYADLRLTILSAEETDGKPRLLIEIQDLYGSGDRVGGHRTRDRLAMIGDMIGVDGYVRANSATAIEPVEGATVRVRMIPPNTDRIEEFTTTTSGVGFWNGGIATSPTIHHECEGTWNVIITASKDGFEDVEVNDKISVVKGALRVTVEAYITEQYTRGMEKKTAVPGNAIWIDGDVTSQFGPEDSATVTIMITDPNGEIHTFVENSRGGGRYLHSVILIDETVTGEESLDSRESKSIKEAEESGSLNKVLTAAGTWSIEVEATKEGYSPASASTTFEAEAPALSSPPSRNTEIIAAGAVAAAAIAASAAVLKRYHRRIIPFHFRYTSGIDEDGWPTAGEMMNKQAADEILEREKQAAVGNWPPKDE
jgi:hypothetical protein